ncbi:MAG: LytTR family transcriptional regulator DNA-binding domain-containing protein [Candidatus Eremiobacterota bacterium]
MYTAIVVDDESPAREELITLINEGSEDIEIIGEASSGLSALRLIAEKKPDIVFLDIQMPGIDGLELAREITFMEEKPVIVFVTAYDEYAIKAFELAATDYILKPAHPKRLKKTLERVISITGEKPDRDRTVEKLFTVSCQSKLTRIIARRKGKENRILVDIQDILYFYARGRDCFLVTEGEEFDVKYNLKELEERLDKIFVRCHKSFLVNINHIGEIIPWFTGSYMIKMNDRQKSEVPVSRKYAKEFKDSVGWT